MPTLSPTAAAVATCEGFLIRAGYEVVSMTVTHYRPAHSVEARRTYPVRFAQAEVYHPEGEVTADFSAYTTPDGKFWGAPTVHIRGAVDPFHGLGV